MMHTYIVFPPDDVITESYFESVLAGSLAAEFVVLAVVMVIAIVVTLFIVLKRSRRCVCGGGRGELTGSSQMLAIMNVI